MRICLATLYNAPSLAGETPAGYLNQVPIMRHLPQALAANGHEVHVVVPHEEMERVFNSADFLLQASRREYSSYAVLEAMASGAIPVVSDIPSFRKMTDNGRYGILFPPGDPDTLARRVLAIDTGALSAFAAAVQERFDQEFSYPAMARPLLDIYHQVVAEQRRDPGECL